VTLVFDLFSWQLVHWSLLSWGVFTTIVPFCFQFRGQHAKYKRINWLTDGWTNGRQEL